jgi:hypothetical protein
MVSKEHEKCNYQDDFIPYFAELRKRYSLYFKVANLSILKKYFHVSFNSFI